MDLLASWPEPVVAYLRRACGEAVAVERLGGMSVARVYRARFPTGSVVIKASPRPAEAHFYETIAGRLRAAAVPIPRLAWLAHLPGADWFILEDIPDPLPTPPSDHGRPDPRVVAVLARLHRTTRDWTLDFPESPARSWTADATDTALGCFPAGVASRLEPPLHALQREAAPLTGGWCWISGDASPPNWGVRRDGSVALYDWELFRRGVPAGDLATIVPGLGDTARFRLVAARYIEEWGQGTDPLPWTLDELARDIAVAKAATVVMLMRAYVDNLARVPDDYITRLVEAFPPWVHALG